MASTAKFKYPSIYNFPPFFTRQPNLQTFETQLNHWIQLLLEYCKFHKIWCLSLSGAPLTKATHKDDDDEEENDTAASYPGLVDDGITTGTGIDDVDTDFIQSTNNSIFTNQQINRSLKPDFILVIYNELIKRSQGSWVNPSDHKSGIFLHWNSLEDWSDILFDWIENTGQGGSVLTLYEIRKSELTKSQEFNGINLQLLIKILQVMVKQGRCQILKDEDGTIAGVKFTG